MRSKSIARASILASVALFTGVAANAGCKGGSAMSTSSSASSSGASSSSSSGNPDGGPDLFQIDPPAVYVAKVKNLLVGLPPTDAEVKQVTADPTQLKVLIEQWQQLPEYGLKMKVFFQQAFQQTQITAADFVGLVPNNGIGSGAAVPYLVQNLTESFARTVLAMNAAHTPFTETMTTRTLMMTPPVMELYAFLDTYQVDDDAVITDTFKKDYPGVSILQGSAYANVSLSAAADPTSPNFMQWYSTDPATLDYTAKGDPQCNGIDPIVYPGNYYTLQWILYGGVYNHPGPNGFTCGSRAGTSFGQFTPDDFGESAWRMVTIEAAAPGQAITKFFDIPALRAASQIVLKTPHPGFFSTPAFFANWPTNQSNQMRVTANQALIVGTGHQVDGTDTTPLTLQTALDAGLDESHAPPGTACFGCHRLLDPTRAILSSDWTYSYYLQRDQAMISQKGLFAFEGVVKPVDGTVNFGATLASHPDFPSAWVQKLCYYASSGPCQPDDPEFLRVVSDFASGYPWDDLVADLFSSPLTTNAKPTQTTALAEIVSVSRRDHLCAALNFRLGLTDVCGLSVLTAAKPTTISQIAGGLPSDGYGRGATAPVLPNNPTLFYRSGVENICEAVAERVIDPKPGTLPAGATSWQSSAPAAAVADFVAMIMAITPSDPRSTEVQTILMNHYNAALASAPTPPSTKKITPTQALESTFVAACLSPSFVGIGM